MVGRVWEGVGGCILIIIWQLNVNGMVGPFMGGLDGKKNIIIKKHKEIFSALPPPTLPHPIYV